MEVFSYNALISGHPGGLTPGTYWGIARDLLTFVANIWRGHWTTFPLPKQDTRERPVGFVTSKMKDPDHGDWVYSPVW